MGSRIMPAIIAVETAKVLQLKDINHYLLGSIAPDAIKPLESKYKTTSLVNYIDDN